MRQPGCQPFGAQMRQRESAMRTGMKVRRRGVPTHGRHTPSNAVVPAVLTSART
ncbi:hypothetical protein XAPC_1017 [Xanthomonas citri pv. punicae str. LMG 859]|nr:hypothetical protein XAPC_1017 [Xanthomonas citri pv. punicae str. LMG 859]